MYLKQLQHCHVANLSTINISNHKALTQLFTCTYYVMYHAANPNLCRRLTVAYCHCTSMNSSKIQYLQLFEHFLPPPYNNCCLHRHANQLNCPPVWLRGFQSSSSNTHMHIPSKCQRCLELLKCRLHMLLSGSLPENFQKRSVALEIA